MKHLQAFLFVFVLASCHKEDISVNTNASDTFYVDNAKAAMRVLVEGNTASRVFLLFVHGGPGGSSYGYNTDYIGENIEDKYACVYWDQRNAGASQGNANASNLSLPQMTEDLKEVIQVLKARYGQQSKVFILGHSFGGLLSASFMTTGTNQAMVNGWIVADGSHNYPLNDKVSQDMLLTYGLQQIALNKNVDKWTSIVNYSREHAGPLTYNESMELNKYAQEAENYFDEVKEVNVLAILRRDAIRNKLPVTAIFLNALYSTNAAFNRDLAKTEFTTSLAKVTTPTLLLYGKYDFVCPPELGEDIFRHVGASSKRLAVSPISGHDIYLQDESFFCNEVNQFIAANTK